ncbi:MAG: ABC transporter permease [Lachnospiraceae bacterium]|nr:ABC transporter permease [Lachnospiraceae bacterium]
MRFSDIIAMSAGNLWKRKVRSFLTILGVMIGTASIVVMLSLGLGLKSAMMNEIQSEGSMTDIQVYNYSYGGNGDDKLMTDETMEEFMALEHVTGTSPRLSMSGRLSQGKYETWVQFVGVSQDYMASIPLAEGSKLPASNTKKPELLIGNGVIQDFYDTKTGRSPYYEDGQVADIDYFNKTLFTQFDATYTTDSEGNMIEQPAKRNIFPVVGVVAGGPEDYNQYCWSVYVDIDTFKRYLTDTYRGQPIPGQPTDKNGKPYKYFCYNEAIVSVDDLDNVEDVQKAINDMGYQSYSQQEWIKSAQQELLIIEAVLGGIGAISLFVAAIGIANTMMMSIYERTKEIGVMKVLGCSLGNIRLMFLTEAAFIGFLGGVVGIMISYILSFICNLILPGLVGYEGQHISVIPIWLVLLSIAFSTLIGMIAGFFPAQRATKLSPLAAIRNE